LSCLCYQTLTVDSFISSFLHSLSSIVVVGIAAISISHFEVAPSATQGANPWLGNTMILLGQFFVGLRFFVFLFSLFVCFVCFAKSPLRQRRDQTRGWVTP
jgi:hypothetical protein